MAPPGTSSDAAGTEGTFWLSTGSFLLLNGVIGYLVVRGESGRQDLWSFTAAMALKFLVTDRGLQEDHGARFDHLGRPAVIASLLGGAAIGAVARLPDTGVAALRAFLAGGILLNVLKEELPEERESNFRAFALGASVSVVALLL